MSSLIWDILHEEKEQSVSSNADMIKLTVIRGSYEQSSMHEGPNTGFKFGPARKRITMGKEYNIKCDEFDIFNIHSNTVQNNRFNCSSNKYSKNVNNKFKVSVRVLAPTKSENLFLGHRYQPMTKLCSENKLGIGVTEGLPSHYKSVGYELSVSSQDHLSTYTVDGSLTQLAYAFKDENIPKLHNSVFGFKHTNVRYHHGNQFLQTRVASMRVEFAKNEKNNQFWQLLFRCDDIGNNSLIYDSQRGYLYIVFHSLKQVGNVLAALTNNKTLQKKIVPNWKITVQTRG